MTEMRTMGVVTALFGGALLMACILRWPFFVEGRKYKRMAAVHPLMPLAVFGGIGALLFVLGTLSALGMWRGGWDFGPQ